MKFIFLDWLKEVAVPFSAALCGTILLGLVVNLDYMCVSVVGLILLILGIFYIGARTQKLAILGATKKESNFYAKSKA